MVIEMKNEEIFSSAAKEIAMMSRGLRRNLKRTQHVDFTTEMRMQEAIEDLQQTVCAIWDEFEDDELTKSWRRPTEDNPTYE